MSSLGIGHNGGPAIEDEDVSFDRDGWIAVARGLRDHWLVGFGHGVSPVDPSRGSFSRTEAWLDLIMECQYKSGTVNNGGRKMRLERGQLVGAVSWLANRWNWTPKTVRGFLDKLDEEGMITRFAPGIEGSPDNSLNGIQKGKQKGKQAAVLTVCKYALYQLGKREEGQATGQAEGKQRARKGQAEGNIYKERNKGTKEQGNKEDTAPSGADVAGTPPTDPPDKGPDDQVEIRALDCFHAWNAFAQRIGLPLTRTLTPDRRKKLKARLTEHGPEAWNIALANIERSAFLRGNNPRAWRANFDFVVQASSFGKLVDGTYGNGAHAEEHKESTAERLSRVLGEMDLERPS